MKNIVLLSSSPKIGEESVSRFLVERVGSHIEAGSAIKTFIDVRQSIKKHQTKEDFEKMSRADALIITFPLYVFCMPGILTRFLQDYHQFLKENGKRKDDVKVYTLVNCGFPEPGINIDAVRVISSFSQHINANFRFGVLIGGGGMLLGTSDKPFMKKTMQKLDEACKTIAADIQSSSLDRVEDVHIQMNFPRFLYLFVGNISWPRMAGKNGLKKKDMYRQPYSSTHLVGDK